MIGLDVYCLVIFTLYYDHSPPPWKLEANIMSYFSIISSPPERLYVRSSMQYDLCLNLSSVSQWVPHVVRLSNWNLSRFHLVLHQNGDIKISALCYPECRTPPHDWRYTFVLICLLVVDSFTISLRKGKIKYML